MVEGIEKTFLVLLRWVFGMLRVCALGHVDGQQAVADRVFESAVQCVPTGNATLLGLMPAQGAFRGNAAGQFQLTPSVPFVNRGKLSCEQWVSGCVCRAV